MAENSVPEDTQAVDDGKGQEPANESQADTASSFASDESTNTEANADEEQIPKSELNKKNKEAQNLRRERNELQKKLEAYENEKLTEQQKLEKRIEDLQAQLQEKDSKIDEFSSMQRRSTFIESIGLPNPRLAWAALSDLGLAAEYDDNGKLINTNHLRKVLKTEFPREFGPGSANGGEQAAVEPNVSMNDILRNRGRV